MNFSDKKILLQYSGGKDSTACLLTMLEKNLYFEAICFTHAYCYEIPISEAQRICKRFGVRLHLVDMSKQLLELFGENFLLRPCRFCKGIMDELTVKFVRENGFELICVGDTASDSMLVNRLKNLHVENLHVNKYFNPSVELTEDIHIWRPLIECTSDDVFKILTRHDVNLRRVNDTGDKYFEYSREGCPLQYKDFGVAYTAEMMSDLKRCNELCAEFATSKEIRASLHLPSEFIVTIPKGHEEECRAYLIEHGIELSRRIRVRDVVQVYQFTVQIYPELLHNDIFELAMRRFMERLGVNNFSVSNSENSMHFTAERVAVNILTSVGNRKIFGHMKSLIPFALPFLENILLEIFHTRNFNINALTSEQEFIFKPLLPSVKNSRYLAEGRCGFSIVRSNSIDSLISHARIELKKIGITTVIDLRGGLHENFSVEGISYKKIFDDDKKFYSKSTPLPETYMNFLANFDAMKNIFETMASSDDVTLYFCTHGKDRTGIISAVLEMLAGMEIEEIVRDYMLSEPLLDDNNLPPLQQENFLEFIDKFIERFGTAEKYLKTIGLSEDLLTRLKFKLEGNGH